MAQRQGSVAQDSSSASGIGLQNVNVNRNIPHPEEWTIPHEWNIEKREMYANWKMDVQNQIANLASSLDKSLNHYPHPEVGSTFNYQDELEKAEMEKAMIERARRAGNTLVYGLARSTEAEKR